MRFVGSLLALTLLAACGEGSATDEPKSDATEYVAQVMVLESREHGPQLCFVAGDSLPPQCSGPDITNWSWAKAAGETHANGSTWGDYVLHGTFADSDFTLTRDPADPTQAPDGLAPDEERDFTTPCPEPAGGWFPKGRPRLDETAVDRAASFAESVRGYSELWLDQEHNAGKLDNDPNGIILNVRVTDDVAGAEKAMRTVWGGALCVSLAKHTDKELRRIQEQAGERAGKLLLGSSSGDDRVDLDVILDEGGRLQKELDEEYGKDVVRVTSALRKVPPGV